MTIIKHTKCPVCRVSWIGEKMFDTFSRLRSEGDTYWTNKTDEEITMIIKSSYSEPYNWDREIGVEYPYDHPEHYDGISEWRCPDCGARIGRWSGRILREGEAEKRFGSTNQEEIK